MPAPTLTSETSSTWSDNVNTDEVTGTLTWNSGDRILVIGMTEDQGFTLAVPTATGLTFSALGTAITVSSSCWLHAWTATAGSSGSGAVTVARSVGTGIAMRGAYAFAFGGCTGFVRTNKGGGSGTVNSTEVVNVTRTQANSFMVGWAGDWSASGTSGIGWTPAGQTQLIAQTNTGATAVVARWGDQGATGAADYGTTGLPGTAFTVAAVEVLGTVGGTSFTRTVDDSSGLVDTRALAQAASPADVAGLTDSAATATAFARSSTDGAGSTDATTALLGRVLTDGAGLTDGTSVTLFALIARTVDDNLDLTDTGDPIAVDVAEAVTDPAGLTDSTDVQLTPSGTSFTRTVDDAAGLVDAAAVASAFARTLTDGAGPTGAVTVVATFARTQTDSAGLTDSTAVQLAGAGSRTADDSAGLSDSLAVASTQTQAETAGLTETVAVVLAAARSATDSAGLADTAAAALSRSVAVTDSAGLTDSVTAQLNAVAAYTRTINDSAGLTSTHRCVRTTRRPNSGITVRPNSGVTPRYALVSD